GRRLERAGWLLGVHPSLDDEVRERIASRLGVPLMRLQTASRLMARRSIVAQSRLGIPGRARPSAEFSRP
ncbi:hypothetical protein JYT20_00470, partial [Rhodothermus sp. AH-315-K08]|nr:hypothetical protein [Rhodothermus sp. AH-315-K08]